MRGKEYLELVKNHKNIIRNLDDSIKDLNDMLYSYSLGGSNFNTKVQTSRTNDKMGELVAKIDDKQRKLQKEVDKYIDFRTKVEKEINALEDSNYSRVLYNRYIRNMTWDNIAEDMTYSLRMVHLFHNKALKEFENKYCTMLKNAG